MITAADGAAVLAMNTLRIVNASVPVGPYRHPFADVGLTFNGEVYNWTALAAKWGLPAGDGRSDAHVVLDGWVQHGPTILADLDGMFALAVYEPARRQLTLARDRLGEKPLYWRLDGGRIAFASEIGALLQYAPAAPTGRSGMLAVETPLGHETPYAGIQLLGPGELLTYDVETGSTNLTCWWSLHTTATPLPGGDTTLTVSGEADRTYDIAVREHAELLTAAAADRVPDVPFALLLSGGLDSAVLAHLMRPPVCVTVRYAGLDRLDEHAAAAQIAADIGAELVVVEPSCEQFQQALPAIIDALGYPMGNAATFSEWAAYQAIADLGIRVAVAGIGPDEFLLGYARHALAVHGADAVLTGGLHAYAPLAAKLLPLKPPITPAEAYARLVLRGPDPNRSVRTFVENCMQAAGDIGRGLTDVDLATSWRPLVLTSDALSSRFGLERRSPYLARDLVEFIYALPLTHKLPAPTAGKQLLRDTARTLGLPATVWQPTDKIGFASPVPAWLNGPLHQWCQDTIRRALTHQPESPRRVRRLTGVRPPPAA